MFRRVGGTRLAMLPAQRCSGGTTICLRYGNCVGVLSLTNSTAGVRTPVAATVGHGSRSFLLESNTTQSQWNRKNELLHVVAFPLLLTVMLGRDLYQEVSPSVLAVGDATSMPMRPSLTGGTTIRPVARKERWQQYIEPEKEMSSRFCC